MTNLRFTKWIVYITDGCNTRRNTTDGYLEAIPIWEVFFSLESNSPLGLKIDYELPHRTLLRVDKREYDLQANPGTKIIIITGSPGKTPHKSTHRSRNYVYHKIMIIDYIIVPFNRVFQSLETDCDVFDKAKELSFDVYVVRETQGLVLPSFVL